MTEYKIWLGAIAFILTFVSYFPYYWGIYKGKTKPHGFSWFVWGTLTGIAFFAIVLSGGGAGGWEMGLNSILCFGIAAIAFWQRHVKYVLLDWMALVGALLGIVFWVITKNPFSAVIMLVVSDTIGFLPTFRKAFYFPEEENPLSFSIGVIKYIIVLFALQNFTATTFLYPAFIGFIDSVFVVLVLIRRKQLAK